MAASQYRRYFVRSGDILTDHIVQSATHAVRAFFRRVKKAGGVHELGELIGVSRRGFKDKEMLFSLTKDHLYINQKTGLVLLPSTIAEMPIEVPEPPAHDFDLRRGLRGPKKPPKDAAAKWRHKCVAEGRCPRCGDQHGGRLVLCETCRKKMKGYREPKRKRYVMEPPATAGRPETSPGAGKTGRTAAPEPAPSEISPRRPPLILVSVAIESLQKLPPGDFASIGNGWYYDPASPPIAEIEWIGIKRETENAPDHLPTPAEIKARAGGVRSRRVDDNGVALPGTALSLAQL